VNTTLVEHQVEAMEMDSSAPPAAVAATRPTKRARQATLSFGVSREED
jgi:hypothetical protein